MVIILTKWHVQNKKKSAQFDNKVISSQKQKSYFHIKKTVKISIGVPLDYNFKVSCQHIIVIFLRWSPLYQYHKNIFSKFLSTVKDFKNVLTGMINMWRLFKIIS